MFLKSLKLKNFRNYSDAEHVFNNGITILVGDNAQGKSNFLESIYFLATAKSPKAERDDELVGYGEEFLRVAGVVESNLSSLEITMQLVEGRLKKTVRVNGIPRRVTDYSEHLAVVAFAPEDINLVTGSPSLRRSHVDQVLSQVDRGYKKLVSSYERIITRKNKVLKAVKDGFGKIGELQFWCEQQVTLGVQITSKRKEFFEFLNGAEKKFGSYQYDYLPNLVTQVRLAEYQEREIEATVSLVGPHRDDFQFVILSGSEARDLSKYGSRGEQRSAVLDLKLAEVSFMEQKIGSRPVLLLDDIFSELDLEHKKHAVELAKLQQTIITTVGLNKYLQSQFKDAEVFRVEEGKIKA